MAGILWADLIAAAAIAFAARVPGSAQAQTRPAVTKLGPDFPKSEIFKQSELNLYVADKRHPSLAGTYLAACTVFAAVTGCSPVGNSYLAGIDEPTARLLQTAASETVQDYYGK